MSLTNKKFSDIITSTRADTQGSCATYFGRDGLLKTKGYNLLLNSVLAGGVSGTPGIFPTSWGTNSASGTTLTYNADGSVRVQTNNSRGIIGQTVTVGTGVFALSVKIVSINTASAFDYISHTLGFITGTATFGAVSYLKNNVAAVAGTTFAVGDTITVLTTVSVGGTITCRIGAGVGANTTQDITISSPMLELTVSGLAGEYSETTTAANSGARLAYDPLTPAGVAGEELVTNGDFSQDDTEWVIFGTAGNVTVSNGQIRINSADGVNSGFSKVNFLTVGKRYRLTFNLISVTGTGVQVNDNSGPQYGTFTTAGIQTVDFTASTVNLQFKRQSGVVDATIDNISVQEATFTPKGYLIEESRTNVLVQSQTFSSWFPSLCSIPTPNTVTSPNGGLNAQLVVASGSPAVLQGPSVSKTAAAEQWTGTIFVKKDAAGPTVFTVTVDDGTATNRGAVTFNTQTMGVGTSITNLGTFTGTVSIDPVHVGNNWYRLGLTTTTDTSTNVRLRPFWTGTVNVSLWGAQLEKGIGATSYIPTTTAARTRGIDAPSIVGTQFSEWYNQSQGTFVIEYSDAQTVAYERRWLSVNDNTTANRFTLSRGVSAGAEGSFGFANSTAITIAASSANTSAAPLVKTAFAYSSSGTTMTTNGISGTAGPIAIPTVTQLNMGHERSVSVINGHIRKVTYYPYKLPDDILQTLST